MSIQKNIQDSPRKLRLVADMVRKMNPLKALEILEFTNKAAAEPLLKAIKTAVANAGSSENLVFKSLEINEASKLKRYRAGTAGRGRGRPYKKRWSHIKIVLTDEIKVKGEKSKVKSTTKKLKAEKTENIEAKEVAN